MKLMHIAQVQTVVGHVLQARANAVTAAERAGQPMTAAIARCDALSKLFVAVVDKAEQA